MLFEIIWITVSKAFNLDNEKHRKLFIVASVWNITQTYIELSASNYLIIVKILPH